MEHPSGKSAHLSPTFSPLTLAEETLLLDALKLTLFRNPALSHPTGHDAIAAHHLRIAAESFQHAVDGMGYGPLTCNTAYVCDQLEKVQENCGRAILELMNLQRTKIADADSDPDDDLPDTVTILEGTIYAPPKNGGAA
jgi:hypothetical protein